MLTAINVPDLGPADDAFTHLPTRQPLRWVGLSGLPANAVERRVPGVRLSRYRAALQAAWQAGPRSFVVSHLPLMTAAVAQSLCLRRKPPAHLGFAFNFTALPTGARFRYLQNALRRVDRLTVFSAYERERYAAYFDIDPARFGMVLWAPETLAIDGAQPLALAQPYLCAVGGEGRDFRLLLRVAHTLGPKVAMVIITRPEKLAGLTVPDNVWVMSNLSLAQVWQIASGSCGVLVPLLTRETCCGHITLVAAKLLGLPLATTYAHATREYVEGRPGVLECEPGDVDAFAVLARRLIDEAGTLRAAAQSRVANERAAHDRSHWAEYLDAFIDDSVLRRVGGGN